MAQYKRMDIPVNAGPRNACSRRLRKLVRIAVLLLAAGILPGQAWALASPLVIPPNVRRVYVEPFAPNPGAAQLQQDVVNKLKASHDLQLVSDAGAADFVVKGNGETWVKGYVSNDARSPSSARQPVVGGYLSLELKNKEGQALWSYLVTPGRFHWNGVEQDMADRIVRLLTAAIMKGAPANAAPAPSSITQISLVGAGATFPAPLYQEWIQSFEELHPEIHITYQAVGSEEGIQLLKAGKLDFAASDAALTDEQMSDMSVKFDHVATVLGAVVPAYNLPGVGRDLRFTPEVLAGVYLGRITRWNDASLRALNHGASLPDQPIVVIHREEGSGTSFAWTSFLSATSPEWKSRAGAGFKVSWPVGKGVTGNEGVANEVAATPGATGYMELTYAIRHRLSYGLVRNAAGAFVQANLPSLSAAAGRAAAATDFRVSLVNAPGKDAYPITTLTWLLLTRDGQHRKAIDSLLSWILTSGQKECSALGYVPLPKELAEKELAEIGR